MPRRPDGRQRLVVLGATGTIGRLTLEVAARHRDRLEVVGLAGGHRAERLAQQAVRWQPAVVALADPAAAGEFRARTQGDWSGELWVGEEAAARLAAYPDATTVVHGIVGAAGLAPALAALEAGHRLALANKEALVLAGGLLQAARERSGAELLPIDSEHSALFQCLVGVPRAAVARLILTASGGPFWDAPPGAFARATPEQALRHPSWRMGPRITIDSATFFNKGLELIEAHWLFDLPLERLEVLVHREAVVHGLVELVDGALLAQLAVPDMRLPIQYALSYPERWPGGPAGGGRACLETLGFMPADEERFPCLRLAREAGERGGTAPAVANGADEVLVQAFLEGRLPLPGIAEGIAVVLAAHRVEPVRDVATIWAADRWARAAAGDFLATRGVAPAQGGA